MPTVVVVHGGGDPDPDLVQALDANGSRVHAAGSASEVMQRIGEWSPDVVMVPIDSASGPVLETLAAGLPASARLIALGDPRMMTDPPRVRPDCILFGAIDEAAIRGVLAGPPPLDLAAILGELLGLSACGDGLGETLQALTTGLAHAFGADDCVLMLSKDMTCYTARQLSDELLIELVPVFDTVCQSETTLIAPARPGRKYRTFLGVPVAHDNAIPFAQLLLCRERPIPFDRASATYLRTLARRMSIDLAWRLVHEELQADRDKFHDGSRVDPVLGVANRLALQEELAQRVEISERRNEPFSVAIIDVDGLDLINRRHGYPAGDAVLAHIAQIARARAASTDLVARYAGDAVALVLPGSTAAAATQLLTRILTEVDAAAVTHEEEEINLTVSAGIAELHYEDDTGEAALGRAVAARQHARLHGNVIGVADDTMVGEPPAPHDFAIGMSLGGVYQLRHEISRGAFGVVYRAQDLALGRQVALKLLRPDLARDTEFVERFRAEAATLAKIRNPNLVQVYAFGIDGSNVYFAMELVEGHGLDERITSSRRRKHHMPFPEVVSIVEQVAGALEAIHRAGMLHRDVKPENVLFDRVHRRCVLVDVGIAIRRGGEKNPAGTPGFTAPEVFGAEGETPATDVYSLGVLAYLLLTLHAPFGDADPLKTLQRQAQAPTPLTQLRADLPPGVEAVLMPALDPDPNRRPQSARAFAKALAAALSLPTVSSRRASRRETFAPPETIRPITIRNASQPNAPTLERNTRGVMFRSAYEILGARRGNIWMSEIASKYPEVARSLAQRGAALAWLPTMTFISVLETLGEDDHQRQMLVTQLGRAAVNTSFSQFFGADPVASGPAVALRAAGLFWRCYHSWGAASVVAQDHEAEVTVTEGVANKLLCVSTSGLLAGIVGHAGGQHVTVDHSRCVADGATSCVFGLAWQGGVCAPTVRPQ